MVKYLHVYNTYCVYFTIQCDFRKDLWNADWIFKGMERGFSRIWRIYADFFRVNWRQWDRNFIHVN